jgi:hypothetical protein
MAGGRRSIGQRIRKVLSSPLNRAPRWVLRLNYQLRRARADLPVPHPLRLAKDGRPDGEIVAEVEGSWEPCRAVRVYGSDLPPTKRAWRERRGPLGIRRYENVILLPNRVVISTDGELLAPSFALSDQWYYLDPGRGTRPVRIYRYPRSLRPARRIEEPVFYAEASDAGFGHTLTEAVPLLELDRLVPERCRVAIHRWSFVPAVDGMEIDRERQLSIDAPLFCRVLYVADPPLELTGNLHSTARAAFARLARLGAHSTIETSPRLFLSRAGIPERRLDRQAEIEALMRRHGFAIVQPERLSLADQIRLVANAEMVAGLSGSAMHNLVFAREQTRALLLASRSYFVAIDRYVAKADDQFGYVFGDPLPKLRGQDDRTQGWTIDLPLVERGLIEHFGL